MNRHANDRRELERCGIPLVRHYGVGDEPWSQNRGELGPFKIQRAYKRWYWVVTGPTPLEVALELYAHPVGRSDIRVSGHCGCPPPEHPWVDWRLPDGTELVRDPDGEQQRECRRFAAKGLIDADRLQRLSFVPEPSEVEGAAGFVDCYHIDSELGLFVWAAAARALLAKAAA